MSSRSRSSLLTLSLSAIASLIGLRFGSDIMLYIGLASLTGLVIYLLIDLARHY